MRILLEDDDEHFPTRAIVENIAEKK